ncbi:energy-coupling factor transport system substrate-specific component [Acetitomaculum ruminis DSM 5522]|uniref:Energy-coupling factor transport system substrate-specific component n=1 Tax=Acetitomaculum ruminis DSM 5522 TaxID=1120918 RepID=A0A1I0XGJ8_9FIRM|nr:MptD family putative ECF transporter S component [Acetitomaculum ruminis]SFB00132.1 energy-coupling factor transport system substrate-specific component [Acetitomaculum ruminis DSM 5522]
MDGVTNQRKSEEKLGGKDLINIGIYAAIYCVIMTSISMLGFIPIMMPMLAVLCPLIGGITMMLFYTKVKKFGMITIITVIIGAFLWITGMGYWPFIFGIVCGSVADLVAKSGNYLSKKKTVLSHGIMNITIFGCFLPLYLDINGYFATRTSFGSEYVKALSDIFKPWTAPIILLCSFIFGIFGALLGMSFLKKHFEKAGIV